MIKTSTKLLILFKKKSYLKLSNLCVVYAAADENRYDRAITYSLYKSKKFNYVGKQLEQNCW